MKNIVSFSLLLFMSYFFTISLVFGSENSSEQMAITTIDDGYLRAYSPTTTTVSWKYPLKLIREKLQEVILIFDPIARYHYKLSLANVRLLEIQDLCQKGKCDDINMLSVKYRKQMSDILDYTDGIKIDDEKYESLITSLYLSLLQQKIVIDNIIYLSSEENAANSLKLIFEDDAQRVEDYWGVSQISKIK